jgi:hypothetical protein
MLFIDATYEPIWTDKYNYCVGETVTISWELIDCGGSIHIPISILLRKPNGEVVYLMDDGPSSGKINGIAGYPLGIREVEIYCGQNCWGSTSFEVQECSTPEPCKEWLHINCNVGGYKLYIDGEYTLTEDGDGECGIQLPSGTYSIKLKKEGCETVNETARIECGYSTTVRITMKCDPCEGKICESKCDDCNYWARKCVNGDCVKDYIIEENSSKCGSECPCRDVSCSNQCDDCNYWARKCVNGDCVKDYIIEENSSRCGSECPDLDINVIVSDHFDKASTLIELIRLLSGYSSGDITEISVTIDIQISDNIDVEKVIIKTDKILSRNGDIHYEDTDEFFTYEISLNHYRNYEPIFHRHSGSEYLISWIINKICKGCLGEYERPKEIGQPIYFDVIVYYSNGNKYVYHHNERLPHILDAIDRLIESGNQSEAILFIGQSPIDLTVIDAKGRKIGTIYDNGTYIKEINEIPNSFYSGRDSYPEIVLLPAFYGKYEILVNGTDLGSYELTTIINKNGLIYSKNDSNKISKGETHKYFKLITETGKLEDVKGKIFTNSSSILIIIIIISVIIFGIYISKYHHKWQQIEHQQQEIQTEYIGWQQQEQQDGFINWQEEKEIIIKKRKNENPDKLKSNETKPSEKTDDEYVKW